MPLSHHQLIRDHLYFLYGRETGEQTFQRLADRLDRFQAENQRTFKRADELFNEQDVIVITYGDLLREPGEPPLETLHGFFLSHLKDVVNAVHILPFYPYSSDDGFSVIDYTAVDPALGTWEDVERFHVDGFRLMFDAVINHISAHSQWFEAFKAGNPAYRDTFITVDPSTDLSQVTRPRALPLLTPVQTARGEEYVWTTFSADQIDLNYKNPDTLLDVVDVLLEYIEHGADIIRLDAIAYLWKQIGTACIHLPQTHAVVQLMRAVLDEVAPSVLLITETNVPHEENISYFGDGTNEAHMVYNFSLPPLTAHALITGSAETLTGWASSLDAPSEQTTFFNFTASHDGVGVRPAVGLLDEANINLLLEHTRSGGGMISSKTNEDGTTSPYELNITYFDLLHAEIVEDAEHIQTQRFIVSQAIMLALAGVPGIYLHSLLGSHNNRAGVEQTGQPRAINREKLALAPVEDALSNPASTRYQVFSQYCELLRQRIGHRAFHPKSEQRILDLHGTVFAVLRQSPDGSDTVLALHNVANAPIDLTLDLPALGLDAAALADCLSGDQIACDDDACTISLNPYQVRWLVME